MDTRRHFVLTVVAGLALLAVAGFVLFHARNPFTGIDLAALVATLVFMAMIGMLLDDIGVRLEMRLPRQFRKLGPGFGLVKAAKSMTTKVEAIRARMAAGEINDAQAAEEERKLFEAFSEYFTDRRWRQVDKLKRQGDFADAKALAGKIREDHGF